MGKIDGNLFRVKIGLVPIGGTTSVSFSISKDLQETTNQDSAGNTEYHTTAGKIGIKGSFDGFYDPDHIMNAEELIDRIINRTGNVKIQIGQEGLGNLNTIFWEFDAMISDISIDAKNDSVPTIKGSFVSTGVIAKFISTGSA